jgi:hypothetical protein
MTAVWASKHSAKPWRRICMRVSSGKSHRIGKLPGIASDKQNAFGGSGQQEQGDGMKDQTCRTPSATLVWPCKRVVRLMARRTDVSSVSLDAVLPLSSMAVVA